MSSGSGYYSFVYAWRPIFSVVFTFFLLVSVINQPALVLWLLALVYAGTVLLSADTGVDEGTRRFYSSCTARNTQQSCICASKGTCDCVEDAFRADEEWERYKNVVCMGLPADPNRLINSYGAPSCNYGSCDATCLSRLTAIENEILAFDQSKCDEYMKEDWTTGKRVPFSPLPAMYIAVTTAVALAITIIIIYANHSSEVKSLRKMVGRK